MNEKLNRRKQLNSAAGTKQLNSSVGTKQLNSALSSTAYNRLQPPATAYKPPATACNRLQPPTTAYNRLQPPAPPLQQNRSFLPTSVVVLCVTVHLSHVFRMYPSNKYTTTTFKPSNYIKTLI
ncbi:hypothetical protein TNCV_3869141 [Trichonephila clavipes]|nr:hypothetical protein TNCV_3869141 [Trichonephila clavipes]